MRKMLLAVKARSGSEDHLSRSGNILYKIGQDWADLIKRIKWNDISGLEVLRSATAYAEFVCMKLNEKINSIDVLLEKLDYPDDPQCVLGILRRCNEAPKMTCSLRCQKPTNSAIKPFKILEAQQREKLQSILGTVLLEEPWTQPIRFGCWSMQRSV